MINSPLQLFSPGNTSHDILKDIDDHISASLSAWDVVQEGFKVATLSCYV